MFKFSLVIIGCQFNYYDAQKLANSLVRLGGLETDVDTADLIIILACSVRQKAADRILGFIRNYRKSLHNPKVIVTACVLEADRPKIVARADYVCDSPYLNRHLATILEELKIDHSPTSDCVLPALSHQLFNDKTAYLTITSGCNNFCTYCAVPYTRGREISKSSKEIIEEAKTLVKNGISHIILLGQNVNSFGLSNYHPRDLRKNTDQDGQMWSIEHPSPITVLLRQLEQINGLERISFLSPNPQDMSDDLIDWMHNSDTFSKELNLPMQSGSTAILKKMNRRYTQREYLRLVRKIRQAVPDIWLSTDIIVGFPGETLQNFEQTVKVVKICRFNKAFIGIYSPRPGTVSAKTMPDNISPDEKKRRFKILNEMVNKQ